MENAKSLRFAVTSAIRQIRFTLGFSDNDNHRARWRGAAAYIPPLLVVTRDPATPGLAVLGRRSFSQRQAGDPVLRRRQSSIKSRGVLDRRSEPGDGSANRETARGRRATTRPQPSPAQGNAQRQRGHVAIRSAMSGKGMPAIPRPQENEGVGEHVRTRFHFDREATCEIAEPKESAPHRTKKTRFFCRTVKRTIRPLT